MGPKKRRLFPIHLEAELFLKLDRAHWDVNELARNFSFEFFNFEKNLNHCPNLFSL